MSASSILELAPRIIFIFIMLSVICAGIREWIERRRKTRAAYLEFEIRQLLHDPNGDGLTRALYNHPLIKGLFFGDYVAGNEKGIPKAMAKGGYLPSYIPDRAFAKAIIDIAAGGVTTNSTNTTANSPVVNLTTIRANLATMDNLPVQRILLNAIDSAEGDLHKMQVNIENWFNDGMDRVSGLYKRSTQRTLFWIALSITLILNLNTISIVQYLMLNDVTQQLILKGNSEPLKDTTFVSQSHIAAKVELNMLKPPVGWDHELDSIELNPNGMPGFWNSLFGPLLGWLITAFAASLGAPFWFDLLNKIINIRSTVKPNQKSGEGASVGAQKSSDK